MAKLIITPLFEPFEDWMETVLGMFFQVAVNCDVARISDFFRKICRIENELRLEECVFLCLGQKTQVHTNIKILQCIINKTGMTGFIAAHIRKQFLYVRIGSASFHLFVQDAS